MTLPTRTVVLVSLAATTALALGACGGGGFDAAPSSSAPAAQSGPASLRMLVGVSNDVELGAVLGQHPAPGLGHEGTHALELGGDHQPRLGSGG